MIDTARLVYWLFEKYRLGQSHFDLFYEIQIKIRNTKTTIGGSIRSKSRIMKMSNVKLHIVS